MSLIKNPLSQKVKSILKGGGVLICPKKFWMSQQNLVNIFWIKNPKIPPKFATFFPGGLRPPDPPYIKGVWRRSPQENVSN